MLASAPAAYLWREWPPAVIRDALWRTGPWLWTGLCVIYVLLTLGPTRQLVASKRLAYWRQCPISPSRWRAFHGIHLIVLHSPALLVLGYFMAPAGVERAVAVTGLVALGTIGPLAWRLGHPLAESRTLTVRIPRPRTETMALARVLLLALTRRRGAASVGVVLGSVALALLGWVATSHVFEAGEVPERATWGFTAASSSAGAVAVWLAWPLVRRQQWWFDSMDVRGWTPVFASVAVVVAVSLPALVVLTVSGALLSPGDGVLLGWVYVATCTWAGGMSFALDAKAVQRRFPGLRRKGRFSLVLALPVPLAAWQPLSLAPLSVAALLRARQVGLRAEATRRRFEIDDLHDDHE